MIKREYDKLMSDLKNKIKSGYNISNKEDGYNNGILCALSKIREVYNLNLPDKEVATKPTNYCGYACRVCNGRLARQTDLVKQNYCHHCGQKIDWS